MANKNLKSIKFPNLPDTYIVPQVDSTLTQTGRPADAKATGDAISELGDSVDEDIDALKEDLSTLNSEGTVPTSEQMLSGNYTEDSVPYHFRRTASDNADREELEIVGGSVAWNQQLDTIVNGGTSNEITYTVSNGKITVTGTATDGVNINYDKTLIPYKADHVYLFIGATGGSSATYQNTVTGYNQYFNGNAIYKPSTSKTEHFRLNVVSGATVNITVTPQIFDLTAMFGSTIADHIYSLEQATAGAGVALFKSLFPKDYYAYDAGSMQSVSGLSEHKTVGFNQWDEEWESGQINGGGTENTIHSKNFCKILPNTTYYATCGKTDGGNQDRYYLRVFFYDASKNFISAGYYNNLTFTTPQNAAYFKIETNTSTVIYGNTYHNDICINLHGDGELDGEYEPYEEHSYPLDSDVVLRGLYKLDASNNLYADGDVYSADGTVTRRYGIVDLGTLNYNYYAPSTFFYTNITGRASNTNCVCALYTNVGSTGDSAMSTVPDMSMAPMASANGQIKFKNSAYTTTGAFKTAMSGVYLVYELATPTTEQADPYVSPQICSPYGTEAFVSTGIVPVGHNTKYPDNLRMKLDNLPWNFASLIAPTESGFKATRNYTTGALLIVNNTLYKATANIANGGTITPNTNVTATTLAEIIAALS